MPVPAVLVSLGFFILPWFGNRASGRGTVRSRASARLTVLVTDMRHKIVNNPVTGNCNSLLVP